jgi:putative ABC transport system permease protein
MSWIHRALNAFWRDRHAGQVSDELESHLALAVEELMADGWTEAEAKREAKRRFGNRSRLADETRDADTFAWLESLLRDLRVAARNLGRRPGLTVTALLSLGLGVGATAAIFSVVDAVILKPLALPEPDRVVVFRTIRDGYEVGGNPARMSDWDAGSDAVEWAASFYGEDLRWRGPGASRNCGCCAPTAIRSRRWACGRWRDVRLRQTSCCAGGSRWHF